MTSTLFTVLDHWQQFSANLHWATRAPVCQRCRQRLDVTCQTLHHCHRCLDASGYELEPCTISPYARHEKTWTVREWTVQRHYQMIGYKRRPSEFLQPLFSDLLVRGWLEAQAALAIAESPEQVALVIMPRHDTGLPNHLTPLARMMAVQLGLTFWRDGLQRVRPLHAAQKTLNARQRRLNLADSLATAKTLPSSGIRQIVVLDDIRTTGASQAQAQRVLTAQFGGVCSIMGLTLLQMPAPDEADPHGSFSTDAL